MNLGIRRCWRQDLIYKMSEQHLMLLTMERERKQEELKSLVLSLLCPTIQRQRGREREATRKMKRKDRKTSGVDLIYTGIGGWELCIQAPLVKNFNFT